MSEIKRTEPITRKVIQHGPTTLVVSLPSMWTKKNSIVKGQEVLVYEDENKLIITNSSIKKFKQKPICYYASMFGSERETTKGELLKEFEVFLSKVSPREIKATYSIEVEYAY